MGKQQTVKGIGASPGVAIGNAFVLPSWEWDIPDKDIDVTQLTSEFERLYQGINQSKHEIEGMKREMTTVVGEETSAIFDAHLAILEDPEFMKEVQGIIERQYKAAEVAVKEVIDHFTSMFDLIEDEYMKERRTDIKDVGNRLLQHLLGAPDITLPQDNQPFILVAKELSPSQLAHLNPDHVLGIATLVGGKNSHAAIMARSMGIPFVISLEDKLLAPILTGDKLIIDGDQGVVYIDPTPSLKDEYRERQHQILMNRLKLLEQAQSPSITKDGLTVSLNANINSEKELELALRNGAEGVGLFRTEFLYMYRSSFPDEEQQFTVYRNVAEMMGDRPIVIRTLDIGGDKHLDYYTFPVEDNPFLGYRAIRFSLDRHDIFRTQLKAILRASQYGNIKIMYPMISSMEELHEANLLLQEAKLELRREGLSYRDDIQVGIMIEVPAAVMIADWLAQEVDFFSIGTNDLIQYVLAVDRMNDNIAYLYDPFHPAIIRMLQLTVEAAERNGIAVSVCGEIAGDPEALPMLLGLGLRDFSMSAHSVLDVKNRLLSLKVAECRSLLKSILTCKTGEEIRVLMDKSNI
ncbi:MAG: phosphoenolpyruvate--protein phosphotransferase [Paenibacillaceae bacterium]